MKIGSFDDAADRPLRIGFVSVSDRASTGVYVDQGIPALTEWFARVITSQHVIESRLVPDEGPRIEDALIELVDEKLCDLVVTTGGTGPARRDVTPEATRAVATREMPGFGEQMRRISLAFVPTAILSRQIAAIRETLDGSKDADGRTLVPGIFAAVPYCIDLIGGPYIETAESIVKAFRPKSAVKP
jgi:molybdopterin adenylyltransferase